MKITVDIGAARHPAPATERPRFYPGGFRSGILLYSSPYIERDDAGLGGNVAMLELMKLLRWDWRDEIGRFNLLNSIWMRTPGRLGATWRNRHIPSYFAAAGQRIKIHEGVRFRGVHRIHCGDDVEIGVDSFLQASGGLVLGHRVILGPGVRIWTINHVIEDPDQPISGQGYDLDPVSIGDDCWLGAGVFVMPGVELPAGCVVSAQSVVARKKYPPFAILAGHPARAIGRRDAHTYPEQTAESQA